MPNIYSTIEVLTELKGHIFLEHTTPEGHSKRMLQLPGMCSKYRTHGASAQNLWHNYTEYSQFIATTAHRVQLRAFCPLGNFTHVFSAYS